MKEQLRNVLRGLIRLTFVLIAGAIGLCVACILFFYFIYTKVQTINETVYAPVVADNKFAGLQYQNKVQGFPNDRITKLSYFRAKPATFSGSYGCDYFRYSVDPKSFDAEVLMWKSQPQQTDFEVIAGIVYDRKSRQAIWLNFDITEYQPSWWPDLSGYQVIAILGEGKFLEAPRVWVRASQERNEFLIYYHWGH